MACQRWKLHHAPSASSEFCLIGNIPTESTEPGDGLSSICLSSICISSFCFSSICLPPTCLPPTDRPIYLPIWLSTYPATQLSSNRGDPIVRSSCQTRCRNLRRNCHDSSCKSSKGGCGGMDARSKPHLPNAGDDEVSSPICVPVVPIYAQHTSIFI